MIKILAAVDKAGAIGAGGGLPWPHLPSDMQRLRKLTMGSIVVMGRKTYDSIGHALPGRRNIVLSRAVRSLPDAEVADDWRMVAELGKMQDVWVLGGSDIFALFLPLAAEIYITKVDSLYPDADVYFPPYDESKYKLTSKVSAPNDSQVEYWFEQYTLK